MQVLANRIKAKELEIGKFYLCQRARAEFSSINIYVGKDYKGYYVFYNVLNIRITVDASFNTLQPKKMVELGTNNMLSMYKDVIKDMLTLPVVKENIRITSGLTGVYNQIDLGFDAKDFVERERKSFDFGSETKLKRVTERTINTTDVYILSAMDELYILSSVEQDATGTRTKYVFHVINFYYANPREYTANLYAIPKMYKLTDVLANSYALNTLKTQKPFVYKYVIEQYKQNKSLRIEV